MRQHQPTGQFALYLVASVAPLITVFAGAPLLTRRLGALEYGNLAEVVALGQLLAVIIACGLPAAIVRVGLFEDAAVPGAAFVSRRAIGVAVLLAVLVQIAAGILLAFGEEEIARPLLSIAIGGSVAANASCLAMLRAQESAVGFAAASLVFALFPIGVGISYLLVVSPSSALSYLMVFSIGQIVSVSIASAILSSRSPAPRRVDLKAAFRVALPTVPHQLATTAVPALSILLAGRFIGESVSGEVQIALLVGTAPTILLNAFNNYWAGSVYKASPQDRDAYVLRSGRIVVLIAGCASLGAAALAEPVVRFLTSSDFDRSSVVLAAQLISATCPMIALYLTMVHEVFVRGRTEWLALVTPAAAAVSLCAGAAMFATGSPNLHPVVATWSTFLVLQVLLVVLVRRNLTGTWLAIQLATCVAALAGAAIAGLALAPPGPLRGSFGIMVAGIAGLLGLVCLARFPASSLSAASPNREPRIGG